jgi:hypothetical protein
MCKKTKIVNQSFPSFWTMVLKQMYVDELEFADGEELTKLLYIVERVKSVNYGRNRAI